MKKFYFVFILAILPLLSLVSQTTEVMLGATIDNTIFKGLELSNGLGEYMFAGTTREDVKKRALIMFDLTEEVPDGIMVDSAVLVLIPTKVKPGSTSIKVHMLTTEWGEGSSKAQEGDGKGAVATANDATWDYARFNTHPWVKFGGDYAFEESSSSIVSLGNEAVFSSAAMTVNVNFWLANPTKNFGWILIGDESTTSTSVKFGTRDNNDPLLWPKLKLYYEGSTSINRFTYKKNELRVYQGTNRDEIIVSNDGDPVSGFMEVYSLTGSMVYSTHFQVSRGENTINMPGQEAGIYIYKILTDGIPSSGKFILSR